MSTFNYKSFRKFLIEIFLIVQVSPNLPANIYLFKFNNKNKRMTSMTAHFEHISVVDLKQVIVSTLFLLLTLNK